MIFKRGLSTVVSTVLVVLLVIVSVGVLFGFYKKYLDKASEDESALCVAGPEVKLTRCVYFDANTDFNCDNNPLIPVGGAYFIVERGPGPGNIRSLRFIITDTLGVEHVEKPIETPKSIYGISIDYSNFKEYSTVEAAFLQIPPSPNIPTYQPYQPAYAGVSAVVGTRSDNVCEPTEQPIYCEPYSSYARPCP